MANFALKFNNSSKRLFDVDTHEFPFVKLADVHAAGGTHILNGIYVHTGKLGTQPVAICAAEKKLVNLPSYLCNKVNDILADPEAVQDIKDGKVGFTTYEYKSEQYGRTCYGITFVDIK